MHPECRVSGAWRVQGRSTIPVGVGWIDCYPPGLRKGRLNYTEIFDARALENDFDKQRTVRSRVLNVEKTFYTFNRSHLPLEDILSGLCKRLLPLNRLFSDQLLGREQEDEDRIKVMMVSNTNANQLLDPCEAAATASLLSINWSSQC